MRITRTPHLAVFAVAVIAAACSSSTDTGTDGGGPTGCTITLTGAESVSPACDGVTAAWTSDDSATIFGFTSSASTPLVIVAISLNGQLSTGTYHNTDAAAVTAIAVSDSTRGWLAQGGDGDTTIGSFTLSITSVSTTYSDATGKVYLVHGMLTATLQADPQTDATGTVTLTAKF